MKHSRNDYRAPGAVRRLPGENFVDFSARQRAKRELGVPERHQLKIARDTLKMSDVGAFIMGGMDKPTARAVILELTGKPAKEESSEC